MENIFGKAKKLLALINHVSTPEQERSAAWSTLQRLMKNHGVTMEQLMSEQKEQRSYPVINDDDQKLIIHCTAVIVGSVEFDVYLSRCKTCLLLTLTEAQDILLRQMIAHYRHEYTKSLHMMDHEVERCKKALADARKARKFGIIGFIHKMKLFPEKEPEQNQSSKSYTKDQIAAIVSAMGKCTGNKFKQEQVKLQSSQRS